MIEHTIRTITLKRGKYEKKKRVIRFADPSLALLAAFINGEADSFRNPIREAFRQSEEGGEGYFAGNLTRLSIRGGMAEITSQIDDEAEKVCIPAEELKILLEEWYSR